VGVLAAIWGVSAVVGPAVGGFMAEQVSWRWAFYVNLPLSIMAMAVMALQPSGPSASEVS